MEEPFKDVGLDRTSFSRAEIGEPARARQRYLKLGNDPCRAWRQNVDAIREENRFPDIMGDQQRRPAVAGPHLLQPFLQLGAGQRVERTERLVQKQHILALYDGQ